MPDRSASRTGDWPAPCDDLAVTPGCERIPGPFTNRSHCVHAAEMGDPYYFLRPTFAWVGRAPGAVAASRGSVASSSRASVGAFFTSQTAAVGDELPRVRRVARRVPDSHQSRRGVAFLPAKNATVIVLANGYNPSFAATNGENVSDDRAHVTVTRPAH